MQAKATFACCRRCMCTKSTSPEGPRKVRYACVKGRNASLTVLHAAADCQSDGEPWPAPHVSVCLSYRWTDTYATAPTLFHTGGWSTVPLRSKSKQQITAFRTHVAMHRVRKGSKSVEHTICSPRCPIMTKVTLAIADCK